MATLAYGSWKSPITPQAVTAGGIQVGQPSYGKERLYWLESRPEEKGRQVLVIENGGEPVTLTLGEDSVSTHAHEYGGGDFLIAPDNARGGDRIFFSHGTDQRIYRQFGDDPSDCQPITPAPPKPGSIRYADASAVPGSSAIVAVRECHSEGKEPVNDLVWIETEVVASGAANEPRVLAKGHDFFSFPRLRRDGKQLAWTTWDHPNMPWDGTELWVAPLSDGELGEPQRIAGGPSESIFQPSWDHEGRLIFASDRTGWWNLYRWDGERNADGPVLESVAPIDAEIGSGQWVFGLSHYTVLEDGRIYCVYSRNGLDHLGLIHPGSGKVEEVPLEFTYYGRGGTLISDGQSRLAFVGATARKSPAIYELDVSDVDAPKLRSVRDPNASSAGKSRTDTSNGNDSTDQNRSDSVSSAPIDASYFSAPEPIEFPTTGGKTAHALYYPPRNPDFEAPEGELPPLIVKSHGGPTSNATSELTLALQYWTSRGFGVVDVNYGGSTGYGREYRQRLNGNWGVVDVDDCINAARYLEKAGRVDGKRMAIRGGSAGGYTTLCALTFHDVFAAGASHYGVADLELLATDTHKFESRYLDSLIGPYPEKKQLYVDRSPVHHATKLACPIILFQGLDDPVVPPSQAEAMVRVMKEKKLPFAYVTFEGEKHGFRDAKNIQRALDAELYFYGAVFGFEPADEIEPVEIENR